MLQIITVVFFLILSACDGGQPTHAANKGPSSSAVSQAKQEIEDKLHAQIQQDAYPTGSQSETEHLAHKAAAPITDPSTDAETGTLSNDTVDNVEHDEDVEVDVD